MQDPSNNSDRRAVLRSSTKGSATHAETVEGERHFSLRDVAQIIRKRLWMIVLVTLVFVGAAIAFSLWQTPVYEASVKLLVRQEQQTADQESISNPDKGVVALQQLTQAAVEAIDSRSVAEETIQRLELQVDPDKLVQNLSAEQIESTPFIHVAYKDADPEKAQEIVNTVGQISTERIPQLTTSTTGVTATIWEDATIPNTPLSPDPLRNGILALALGLMLSTGLAFVLGYLDDSWRSPDEVEQVSGVPTLGSIPMFESMKVKEESDATKSRMHRGVDSAASQEAEQRDGVPDALVATQEPESVASEAYRMLRTNLFYPPRDSPPKVIVVTSTGRGEGKTTTVANLGVTLAQADRNTLILDCDLRSPALHRIFGLENTKGLVDILAGGQKTQEVWQEPIPRLKMISAGPSPPNPADLLSSRHLVELLGEMRQEFEYVLVDAPPLGVSDSFVVAANGDGVLLVIHSQLTSKASLRQVLGKLHSIGANVLGTVMNGYGVPKDNYYSSLPYKT